MEAFLVSILTVGIAELGDRSLFLAICFGVQYQRPWPVFWGMAAGLFVNQALSALVGVWLFQMVAPEWQSLLVGLVFLAMAVWVLIPESDGDVRQHTTGSLFLTSAVAFFFLEMADKTQLAVITLAGAFDSFMPVVLGATLGILLVTTPALWLGCRFADWLPMKAIRILAAGLFLLIGAWLLMDAAGFLPELAVPAFGDAF